MKHIAQILALVIGLTALNATPAHAYGSWGGVDVTIDIDYNTGYWDDTIFRQDSSNANQVRCPRLAFFPYWGNQVNAYAAYTYGTAPGYPPDWGANILTHCTYTVTFQVPAYKPFTIDVYPLCGSTANIAVNSPLAHLSGTAVDQFRSNVQVGASITGPYRNKYYWHDVVAQCGGSTAYYFRTSISYFFDNMTHTSDWY